ncbi:MAG: hypothetical protein JSU92_13030 [Deltaproteobacteria bacterium]|nr:MAG: hypothetical protein JSU92_13030 [Deltaproteobacteria bacterium]
METVNEPFKKCFLFAALIILGGSTVFAALPQDQPIDRAGFKNPPKIYRPWVRWWWPGNDVAAEELRRELRVLDEAGFGGAEIQAFTMGLNKKMPAAAAERVFSFASPSYFEHVLAAVEEADRLGLQIDLTLGSGWPFGGTHIDKELSLKTLLWNEIDVKGPKKLSKKLPSPKKPLFYKTAPLFKFFGMQIATYYRKDFHPIAAVAARPLDDAKHSWIPWNFHDTVMLDSDSLVDLSDRIGPDGRLKWEVPEGKWKVIIFYLGPNGSSPTLLAEKKPGLTMDHFSREALEAHIARVLVPGHRLLSPYYGKALRGFFTDSLELKAEHCWTEDFLAEFARRRGYELTPYLPAVPVPMKHNMITNVAGFSPAPEFDFEGGNKVRYDVDLTLAELYYERFVLPLSKHAETLGLKSRLQAHGMRTDIIQNYGEAHIPETEQLYAGGNTDFLKLASSGGHLYGRDLITAEAVVWGNRDYMTTPLKIKAAVDKLFIAGINGVVFHGFPYTYRESGFGSPAWAPFSSPFMSLATFSSNLNEENPFFKYLPVLNNYISRCQYVLRQGENVADVALYFPLFGYPHRNPVTEELTSGLLDRTDAPLGGGLRGIVYQEKAIGPENEWVKENIAVADQLMAYGFNYDHVNEESILNARVQDGMILIRTASYRVLILNRIEYLSLALAKKLESLAHEGAAIVFVDTLPKGQPEFKDYIKNDALIRQIVRNLKDTENKVILTGSAELAERIRSQLGIEPDVIFDRTQPSLDYIHRRTGTGDYFFLRNSTRETVRAEVKFPAAGRSPEFWDPWTGEVTPASGYRRENDRVAMNIELGPYGSLLLRFERTPEQIAAPPMESITSGPISTLSIERWHLETELVGTNGSKKPVTLDMEDLKDWRELRELSGCSSPGRYRTTVNLDQVLLKDRRIMLDLGDVRDAAEVRVNDKDMATLIVPPFSCDLTRQLKPGANRIEVLVTPTLYNRLARWGASGDKRYRQFRGRKNLMPSGLLGPVSIKVYPLSSEN